MNDNLLKAQNFVDKLKKEGIIISNASVFGSVAMGSANEYSDIDVCVVSPNFGKDFISEIVKLRKISLSVDSRIEPLPLSPSEFLDPYNSLATQIRKNSIPLR